MTITERDCRPGREAPISGIGIELIGFARPSRDVLNSDGHYQGKWNLCSRAAM